MMTGVLPFDAENPKDIAALIVNEEPEYSWDEFTCLSKPLQELIQRMLTKDPKMRISIEEILDHPWLKP